MGTTNYLTNSALAAGDRPQVGRDNAGRPYTRLLCAFVLCAGLVLPSELFAHGTEKHDEKPAQVKKPATVEATGAQVSPAHAPTSEASSKSQTESNLISTPSEERAIRARPAPEEGLSLDVLVRDLNFDDFPTLHPLAVHVPVTFIPLALLFAMIGLSSTRRIFRGLAFGFALGGLLGGLVAAFPLHPHTTGLSDLGRRRLSRSTIFLPTARFGWPCLRRS